jgi:hypothetical protein
MPQLVIRDTVEVKLIWEYVPGRGGRNVLHGIVAGNFVVTQAIANNLGGAVASAYTTSGLAALCPASVRSFGVSLRDIRTPNQPELISSVTAVPGTAVGDLLPKQTAFVVTLRTAQAGRSYRGRVYLGGFSEGNNDVSGNAAAAVSTASVAFITAVQGAMSAQAITLAVGSRANIPLNKTDFSTPVTAIQARNNLWDTQRKRAGRT